METSETIETINNSLANLFGREAVSNQPMFRVVWSEDQFEKRLMDVTDEGFALLTPQVRMVPKYRQWIPEKYVLERLVLVPEQNVEELAGTKVSYEPLWIFETQLGKYLPPRLDVAKFVIDTMYASLGKKSMRKYVDDMEKNPVEATQTRIDKLQQDLFGNETAVGDALAHKDGVSLSGPRFELTESASPKKETIQ